VRSVWGPRQLCGDLASRTATSWVATARAALYGLSSAARQRQRQGGALLKASARVRSADKSCVRLAARRGALPAPDGPKMGALCSLHRVRPARLRAVQRRHRAASPSIMTCCAWHSACVTPSAHRAASPAVMTCCAWHSVCVTPSAHRPLRKRALLCVARRTHMVCVPGPRRRAFCAPRGCARRARSFSRSFFFPGQRWRVNVFFSRVHGART
jgi:hypothetical protein